MTRTEKSAGIALALIFALRMLGLFLILPVFRVHANEIPGGDNLTLVGIVLGAYGLTQSIFQIPFGIASDRFGRKPVIVAGLLLFALGSAVAALGPTIWWTIAGRVIQGAGAISAAVTAMAADLTREQHRTKVMAMIGSSIGVVFALSLVTAPVLYEWVGMAGLFWLTAFLSIGAIFVVRNMVPEPPPPQPGPKVRFTEVLSNAQLLRLNFGIFTLHATQMAMFVVVPALLVTAGHLPVEKHWQVYLPAVLLSFITMIPAIIAAERYGKSKPILIGTVMLLLITQGLFWHGRDGLWGLSLALYVFFVAFNILEASLPSLISRIAPSRAKGAALGVYNTTQALGLFAGGACGGYLAKNFGAESVFEACAALAAIWLGLAFSMKSPPRIAQRAVNLNTAADMDRIKALPGVLDASLDADRHIAHLRVNLDLWDERRARQIMGGKI
ncbi:MAG: MFS transporter [Proteobacteria bacterium]|nr:MFS transporter [Pseudomonadota bacterium]HQR04424.1 MFS transporter [Rhodocyclaceae bacterium]